MTPLATKLASPWLRFAAAEKRSNGAPSRLALAKAISSKKPLDDRWKGTTIRTSASTSTREWKAFLRKEIETSGLDQLPQGALAEVQLAWKGSRRRNWVSLWKATGDAMGPILGVKSPERPYDLYDDRITRLQLHWNPINDPSSELRIGLWWSGVDDLAPGTQ